MKKKAHSESEKAKAVHQLESGVDAVVVAREYNISGATLYNRSSSTVEWRSVRSNVSKSLGMRTAS